MSTEPIIAELPQTAPDDVYNRELVAQVHPTDWTNPVPKGRCNMVVIGAGTAGLVTAAGAAGLGAKVALIERDLMGGDCLNVGCVPSKALIRCARAAAEARKASQFGVNVSGVEVDFPAVMERMRRLRAKISHHDSASRFRDLGVDVYIGAARFTGPGTVEVAGQSLEFARACVATGARAAAPPIPGLDSVRYLTNETLFSLTMLPRRLGVIGAGPIGCEMAQAFARFGSEVFLVEATHGILPREDRDAAAIVQQAMLDDGVRLLCCGKALELSPADDGAIRLRVEAHEAAEGHGPGQSTRGYDQVVDELLVSVGRKPNVQGLGLEAAGVEYDDRKGVKVDDRLRTTNPRIYAAGDVCLDHKFTHTADAAARIVISNALFFGRGKVSSLTVPWCTYTEPEIAHVGLYEEEVKEKGIEVDTIDIKLDGVDRAILDGEDGGFLRVIHKKGSDEIVGATIVAARAGDLIAEVTLAMTAGKGLKTIAGTIHPYPTQAEVIKRAGDAFNRTRLTPGIKRLLETVLRWRR